MNPESDEQEQEQGNNSARKRCKTMEVWNKSQKYTCTIVHSKDGPILMLDVGGKQFLRIISSSREIAIMLLNENSFTKRFEVRFSWRGLRCVSVGL